MDNPMKLEKPRKRRFVPDDINLRNWSEVEAVFKELKQRRFRSIEGMERWLHDMSELLSCLSEEWAKLYIDMTTQTDDKDREKAYLDFMREIKPRARLEKIRLMKKYMKSSVRALMPEERYFVLGRSYANQVEIFNRKNLALGVRESRLAQRYQKLMGAMTVRFEGREQTLQQMARYLEDQDRPLRRKAWEKITARRLKDKERIEGIFDKLFMLRQKIAENAGFSDYRDYAFRERERFDYTVEDCERFHDSVERAVAPLYRSIQESRRRALGLDVLKPWDLAVDVEGRPRLRPFDDAVDFLEKTRSIFQGLDKEMGEYFSMMAEKNLLDLESRKGKAPGGYCMDLEESRLPFIFMNAACVDRDVYTLLHESGHSFHTLLNRDEPLIEYRSCPLEFAEVASMSMELLGAGVIEKFYGPEDARRSRQRHLEEIISIIPWIAAIDAFQHWLYTHPDHTRDDRKAAWISVKNRFGGIEDYKGFEDALAYQWHRQLHIFQHPFYYIEYGIAQLGALELWLTAKKDISLALSNYKRALALGGTRPLPELFKAAGLNFDFSEQRLIDLTAKVRQEIQALEQSNS